MSESSGTVRGLLEASRRTIAAGERAVERRFQEGRLLVTLAVALFLVGFLLVAQWRGVETARTSLEAQSDQDLALIVNELGSENDVLRREALVLEERIAEVERSEEGQQAVLNEAVREIRSLRAVTGLEGARGPGVAVRLSDPQGVLLAQDLADLVNELRAAGAEALDAGGIRVGATSGFSDGPSGVILDGVLLESTLTISAIGDPATLGQALEMPGGIGATLGSFPGVQVSIQERDDIEVGVAEPHPMEEGTPF